MDRLSVGILGATGAVGQRFVELLADHPWFQITHVAASPRSAGKPYHEAAHWIGQTPIPPSIANLTVVQTDPDEVPCDVVFSGLDSSVATEVEKAFAEAGRTVISNAKNYRMHPQVPLLIPEVNPEHTALLETQTWPGRIVTNPNCSTVGLVCALKPLADAFGLDTVHVTTLQALSGAGYPGVSSLDAVGNVVPYIGGEEDKLVTEPRKLLGALQDGQIAPYDITVSAQCTRVPVLEGHLECVSVKLRTPATPDEVTEVFRGFQSPIASLNLPSAPEAFLEVHDDPFAPQPRRHVDRGRGMTVSIGRIRACEVQDVKFVVLSHNTIRGAAGGAVLNAELLHTQRRLLPASSNVKAVSS